MKGKSETMRMPACTVGSIMSAFKSLIDDFGWEALDLPLVVTIEDSEEIQMFDIEHVIRGRLTMVGPDGETIEPLRFVVNQTPLAKVEVPEEL